ncbi:MAG: (E)-4-hydroxy-3-methylbut-2-enyl-diphosphate synthase [Myxococcota bacterium]
MGDPRSLWTVDPFVGVRRATREVAVGDVRVGGRQPIRIQSMTNTDTLDTGATVDQVARLAEAGCEIVRVTAPSIRDAENLEAIVAALRARGVRVPLVADIHFTPNAAVVAAEFVEKVRINPGNYADRKKFEVREYSDADYDAEIERVAERFRPLVKRCRANGVAMRIGTNHGSLSDRIMNRYGDTPAGMVESALEFLDVCEDEGYRDVVFSMKSSNPQVAIQAYRLLAARLSERSGGEPSYPFHVGVTEAGDGEDGRIKSAIGIGSLLEDGIGDTIRVSLTEDPVMEVPVARELAARCERRWQEDARRPSPGIARERFEVDPFDHERRATRRLDAGGLELGGDAPVRVELDLGAAPADPDAVAAHLGTAFALLGDLECESLALRVAGSGELEAARRLRHALAELGVGCPVALRTTAAFAPELLAAVPDLARLGVEVDRGSDGAALAGVARPAREAGAIVEWALEGDASELASAVAAVAGAGADPQGQVFSVRSSRPTHAVRALVAALGDHGLEGCPIILRHRLGDPGDAALLDAAIDLGASLCDGVGDAVSIDCEKADPARAVDAAYRILQGSRLRTTRTEYISCPSCGRTLFDLEETTAKIKQRTEHLKGVKIAVMGCIVNGPGEMADADFGYVGSGPGVVSLYVGKEVVERRVPEDEAPDRLVSLIRDRGRWVDPA